MPDVFHRVLLNKDDNDDDDIVGNYCNYHC